MDGPLTIAALSVFPFYLLSMLPARARAARALHEKRAHHEPGERGGAVPDADGDHTELMARGGLYRRLYRRSGLGGRLGCSPSRCPSSLAPASDTISACAGVSSCAAKDASRVSCSKDQVPSSPPRSSWDRIRSIHVRSPAPAPAMKPRSPRS